MFGSDGSAAAEAPTVTVPRAMSADELVVAARALVAGLEPGAVLASEAKRLVDVFAELEKLAGAAKTLLARRVADTRSWRRDGDKSAAHWLARTTGTGVGDAVGLLEAAGRLQGQPRVAEAYRSGKLSGPQLREVSDTVDAAPALEQTLLDAASTESLGELRQRCRREKAAAIPDEQARHERIRRDRYLRTWSDPDGAACGVWKTTPDAHAVILAALDGIHRDVFDQARTSGDLASFEAYQVDALVELARRAHHGTAVAPVPAPPGRDAKILVRIDHAALVRGHTVDGETCEIAGIGPVPVSVAREWMDDAFLAAIVTKGVDVVTVAHLGRRPTAHQRSALQWRDPLCVVQGCAATVAEIDHRIDWATSHHTHLPELDGLCVHHHRLKTHHGYQLEPGTGKRRLLPPPAQACERPDEDRAPP